MCSYCVVPYVRGAERSRDAASVIREVNLLYNMGYREVTLLGQNVDHINGIMTTNLLAFLNSWKKLQWRIL